MLQERERTGGTGDTPPHTLLSATGPGGGGGGANKEGDAAYLNRATSWAGKDSSAHAPTRTQTDIQVAQNQRDLFQGEDFQKEKKKRKKKKKKKHRVFWLVPPCFKSSSVFHLSAEAAAESKQRQCKPLRLDFLHVSSEMCTNCPTTLRMRCGRVLRFLSTGFILQWNIYMEHFTAGVFALQLDLKLNGSVLRLRHRQQQQQHFSSIKTHHVTNVCFFLYPKSKSCTFIGRE